MKYLQRHKLLNVRTQETASSYEPTTARTTRRRMNAWQQANQDQDEDWY
jgi:hypothetical protein